jgi:hypothetical protein
MKKTLLRLFAFQIMFLITFLCNNSKESAGRTGKIYTQKDMSFYCSEPGENNIQVISEKVFDGESDSQNSSQPENAKLMSLILISVML